ncbi:MAG: Dna2/Cas4 domain-containing protein [Anaerolineae bacterium]|nr:Dna2/Cas4 domain-containing protein [Anaerolineae bacterium]
MNGIGLILLALLLVIVALVVMGAGQRQQQTLRIPKGIPVYADTEKQPGPILYSHEHQLKGRPDLLLDQDGKLIPVEVKSGRTPTTPYQGHIMQLIAYCVLVEAHYAQRPAYGVIRYPERDFTIEFTEAYESQLHEILAEMRQKRRASQVHRSHRSANICAACGFYSQCDERLDTQLSLFDA